MLRVALISKINASNLFKNVEFHEQNFSSLTLRLNSILPDSEINISLITSFKVRKIIDKLDKNTSEGKYGIGPKVLKHCVDTLTLCIPSIINNSI